LRNAFRRCFNLCIELFFASEIEPPAAGQFKLEEMRALPLRKPLTAANGLHRYFDVHDLTIPGLRGDRIKQRNF
jgi:cephalosporin-C deacetylase-like acetyl esterase